MTHLGTRSLQLWEPGSVAATRRRIKGRSSAQQPADFLFNAYMDWVDTIIRLGPVVVPLVGLFAASIGKGTARERRDLAHDAEIAMKLPEGEARTAVLNLVELEARALADTNRRRDVPMLVVSLVCAVGLGYLTTWLVTDPNWWRLMLAILTGTGALLFTYGVFECAQKVPRDSKGVAQTPTSARASV